jgi:hypothetical protein
MFSQASKLGGVEPGYDWKGKADMGIYANFRKGGRIYLDALSEDVPSVLMAPFATSLIGGGAWMLFSLLLGLGAIGTSEFAWAYVISISVLTFIISVAKALIVGYPIALVAWLMMAGVKACAGHSLPAITYIVVGLIGVPVLTVFVAGIIAPTVYGDTLAAIVAAGHGCIGGYIYFKMIRPEEKYERPV